MGRSEKRCERLKIVLTLPAPWPCHERMNEFSETEPELPQVESSAGEFVTGTFDYDDGRTVTVYIPPDPPEAIVFAADGEMIARGERYLKQRMSSRP